MADQPRVTAQALRALLEDLRDLLASAGPVLLLVAALVAGAYWWLDPQPPRTVTLATGPAGSAYAEFGQRYAKALAQEGIKVQLLTTEGTVGNLQALRDGTADVAFVRGGSDDTSADANAGITSLGALFYEPLWVFYRPAALVPAGKAPKAAKAPPPPPLSALGQLQGLRVNVDQSGSGVPDLVRRLLQANGLDLAAVQARELPPEEAAHALQAGELDALVLVTAPESPVVQWLLRQPGIALADLPHADALSRRFPFLQTVSLPRGMVDLAGDLPPQDIGLLAATTALLTRDETHPALRQLFAQAAQKLHGGAGWFNGARDFPNTRTSELPVSPEGDRAINGTPPFWQRYLPFWASNLLERMWLVIGGLIVLLLPLSRVLPPLYTYRVRQRVFRWYARLRAVEARMDEGQAPRDELLNELDELDRVASQITVPLAHADELYALRSNIEKTRRRLLTRSQALA
ncbi:C4-dicarboxylate ABC transporter substrate-binding protein [Aquabacterium lacunae]|uniref:C4-dicarboxylate ABC transporter substrate-binding protein n=1 Tax=Aquabacterium lacunae TaxID=2528630 RepID=A0A4Q9GVG6_9BURK|nr:TAXI family TRAP transporter solute-binding subunit [Aquabacterium lacunae]TBO27856.1 C4-dicarboxylate ABC transporter substrate-binding protein [Aquabacterium lacunae]